MAARLITESDVREGRVGNPIVVDAGTVITPSAIDLAHARGLRIEYRRSGAAWPRLASPPQAETIAAAPTSAPAPQPEPAPIAKACGCAKGSECGCQGDPVCAAAAPKPSPKASSPPSRDWVDTLRGMRGGFDASAFRRGPSGSAPGEPRRSAARAVLTIDLSAGGIDAAIAALEALKAAGFDVGVELRGGA